MLEELLEEINELKSYKHKYNCAVKDKIKMSELLYEYMTNEYNSKNSEEIKKDFAEDICNYCRNKNSNCNHIPDDVGKPTRSNDGYIPYRKGCNRFLRD